VKLKVSFPNLLNKLFSSSSILLIKDNTNDLPNSVNLIFFDLLSTFNLIINFLSSSRFKVVLTTDTSKHEFLESITCDEFSFEFPDLYKVSNIKYSLREILEFCKIFLSLDCQLLVLSILEIKIG